MVLNAADYKKIIARRDPRYDGRFFFGVKTTRIYCRPVCPARPKEENIIIFRSHSEAEVSGYRPCRRCHPDLLPGSRLLEGTSVSVQRALKIIDESLAQDFSICALAEKLGMTDRHLRRLFDIHLGASPIQITNTKRLHLAIQLVKQTSLPLTEIAFAVGFNSIRRFNESFKKLYHLPPSSFRKTSKKSTSDVICLKLRYRAPYDWPTLLSFLNRHSTFGRDLVLENSYYRFLPWSENQVGVLKVSFSESSEALNIELSNTHLAHAGQLLTKIRSLFDLDHNPNDLPKSKLDTKGIRVPGSFDHFETAVGIIMGQLISTSEAKRRIRFLIEMFGKKIADHVLGDVYQFPAPADLVHAEIEKIGITKIKADGIRGLSKMIHEGTLCFDHVRDHKEIHDKLALIRGIGPWTIEMIKMRCLGDPDAWPKTDLVIKKAQMAKLYKEEEWKTNRAYLTHALWKNSMMDKKEIK